MGSNGGGARARVICHECKRGIAITFPPGKRGAALIRYHNTRPNMGIKSIGRGKPCPGSQAIIPAREVGRRIAEAKTWQPA